MDPLHAFLKYAESTRVKSHSRIVRGKTTQVAAHTRTTEEEDRKVALRARQGRELALWQKWKDRGQQVADLRPLLKSFKPVIKNHAYKYRDTRLPPSAVEAEFQIQFVKALRSYDPSKGSLGTHVHNHLKKGMRWIAENQNIARIPENRVYKIGQYKRTQEELSDKLGREPELPEMAKALDWSLAEVDRMDSELRKDLFTQSFVADPWALVPSQEEETLRLFKYELTGKERVVYEHLTGYGRKKLTKTSDIAKSVGIQDYQVSRIKNSLKKKLERYLTGR